MDFILAIPASIADEAVTEGDPGDGGVTFYFVKHVNNV